MNRQQMIMLQYNDILGERIAAWPIETPEAVGAL
jgi:hypothetical protein